MRTVLTLSVLLTTVLASAIDARAQTSAGFRAGAVHTNLSVSGSGTFDTDGDFGFVVGGFVGFTVAPRVRLQPEFLVTERAFRISGVSPTLSVSSRAFEMPVFIQARFGDAIQPFVQAGPQVTVVGKVTQTFGTSETDISSQINDIDVGMAFGGGVEVPAMGGALLFEGRMHWGFRDLSAATDTKFYLRGVMLLGGYRF